MNFNVFLLTLLLIKITSNETCGNFRTLNETGNFNLLKDPVGEIYRIKCIPPKMFSINSEVGVIQQLSLDCSNDKIFHENNIYSASELDCVTSFF